MSLTGLIPTGISRKSEDMTEWQFDKNDIKPYFFSDGLNCAESTIKLLIDHNAIDADQAFIKAMSGFGGGMQKGLVCGAVIASVAVIGLYTGRTSPEEDRASSAAAVKQFLQQFEERFGSLMCCELSDGYISKSKEMYASCSNIVTGAAEIVMSIIS